MNSLKRKIKKIEKIKEKKKNLLIQDKIRLNYLYLSTNKIYKKLKTFEKNKNKQNLKEYQNHLLDIVRPSISRNNYIYLKDRLIKIRNKSLIKENNSFSKIKEIEEKEEDIINNFNFICEKYEKYLKTFDDEKKSIINKEMKLPLIDFVSCFKEKKLNKQLSFSK